MARPATQLPIGAPSAGDGPLPSDASIRRRLTGIILGTTTAALLLTCAALFAYEFLAFRRDASAQLATLGRVVATNSTAALAFNDPADAREILAALRAEPQIVAAALYDADGSLFASFPEGLTTSALPVRPADEAAAGPRYRFAGGYLEGFEPVVQGESWRVGTLYLRADTRAIYSRLMLYGLIAGSVLGVSVFVAFLISRRLQSQITQPFGQVLGRLRSQLARLELLNRITRAISERQDPASIFKVVLHSLEEDLPLDFCCICHHEPPAEVITVARVGTRSATLASDVGMTEGTRIAIGQNGLAQCLQGKLVYEPQLGTVLSAMTERLAKAGLGSLVIAPLRAESSVFGLLIAARCATSAFSSGDCEFLRQLSEHAALSSHQSNLHAALQQAYDDLRQSQQIVLQQERLRALGQMASGIAHDINNAISPVALYTESLLTREPNLSERSRDYLRTIQRAVDDVALTVARMREFYRPREAQLVLAQVDLNALIRQVLDLTRARWFDVPQQQGIMVELRTELATELPAIMGAENEIRDALTNLIFNAVDAMPRGGLLTLHSRLVTWELHDGHALRHAVVEVRDTGVGMDEETRRRCLEPFYTTKGERGTGLGLAMVFGMVKRHSADLEIESAPSAGTVARLIFPVPSAAVQPTQTNLVMLPVGRLRILVVDDDPLLLKSLRDILEADGHVVTTAPGGQAGIDAFVAARNRGEPFAIVITDLGMPYVDGRKLAATVHALDGDVPIVMLTGWGQRLIDEGELPEGVDRVLSKPPRLHELRTAFADLA